MNLVNRAVTGAVSASLGSNKVILIFGTRRVGKTVLMETVLKGFAGSVIKLNGEDIDTQELLERRSIANYTKLFGDTDLLVIDEAQAIADVGRKLKLMIDALPNLTIIATGSSSFDLLNKTGEPLTGRMLLFHLYPLSQMELLPHEGHVTLAQNFEERLIYGSYPQLLHLNTYEAKADYLRQLVQSYLLKDILIIDAVRQPEKLIRLLRLIAHQVGSEVSATELGRQLDMSKNTVDSYLDLLSKVFIVFKLPAYSTNPRKELSKSVKWYFWDNGIRNALINNFDVLAARNDIGALWENFLIAERMKRNEYKRLGSDYFFWRTYSQQEIDLIEYSNGKLNAYELKFKEHKKTKIPPAFAAAYPDAAFNIINKENYLNWLTE